MVTLGGDSLDQVGPDLRALVVGSEGTVGIVTEITVRLLRKPEAVRTLVADFPDAEHAGNAVSDIIAGRHHPRRRRDARRAGDRGVREGDRRRLHARRTRRTRRRARRRQRWRWRRNSNGCRRSAGDNHTTHIRIANDPAERALIWKGRKAAFAAMGRISPDYFVQDGVIPRTKLGSTLTRIAEMSQAAGLRVANVFHAGDGNLHPLVLYDGAVPGQAEKAEHLATAIVELCVDQGGSITGEHGVGSDKACSMPTMFTDGPHRDGAGARRLRPRRDLQPGQGAAHPAAVRGAPRPVAAAPAGVSRRHRAVLKGGDRR